MYGKQCSVYVMTDGRYGNPQYSPLDMMDIREKELVSSMELAGVTKLPFPEDLTFQANHLRELRSKISDMAVLEDINKVLAAYDKKKADLEESAASDQAAAAAAQQTKEYILNAYRNGQTVAALKRIKMDRCRLMDELHDTGRKVDIMDYLIRKLEKEL